ncbi:hypothetical protein FF1_034516 [Malus domestica]
MLVERSFEVWEEVQRHGQDLADRLTQGFTGLIQSHITPPPIRSPGLRLHSSSSPNPQAPQPTKGTKKVAIAASVGIVTLGMLSGLVFFLYRHRVKHPSESQKLVNGRIHRSQRFTDDLRVPPSSFLYISTVEPSHTSTTSSKAVSEPTTEELNRSPYRKSNSIKRSNRYRPSPELQLLPPLHHHLALHLCESLSVGATRKRRRTCAGSMETRTTPITRSGTRTLVAEASNLCTRIASYNGSITAMLANARHLCELGGQDVDREDEEERNGARATRRAPGQANRNFVGDVNGEDAAEAQGIAGAVFDGLDDADGAEDVPFDEVGIFFGIAQEPQIILWNDVSSHYLEQEQGKPRDDGLRLEVCSILSLSPSSVMAGSATGSGLCSVPMVSLVVVQRVCNGGARWQYNGCAAAVLSGWAQWLCSGF